MGASRGSRDLLAAPNGTAKSQQRAQGSRSLPAVVDAAVIGSQCLGLILLHERMCHRNFGACLRLALLSKGAELNTTAIASKGAIQFHT